MKKCKLGEIADFKTGPFGTQFSSSEYTSTGIPMINIENISNGRLVEEKLQYISKETQKRLSVHAVKEGDIIFGRAGSVDRHLYIFDEYEGYVQGSNCIRMRPTIKVNSRYLSYYLLLPSVKKQIINQSAGSVQAFLNTDKLKSINIVIQDNADKIAKFLDSIESKIFVNNKAICTLESLSKTLYDYYFLQFDFPDEKGRPYKSSGGKMEYNAELGREIPAGWKVRPLGSFAQVTQGNSPEGNSLNEVGDGIAFYQGKTDFGFRFPNERIYTTSPYRYAEAGDTLLSVRAPVGSVNLATSKCCIGRGLAAIHHGEYPSLTYYMMQNLRPVFEQRGSGGTTFDSITKDDIKDILICVGNDNILNKFESKVRPIDKKIRTLTDENRHLTALRDFLLPLLMNGQVGFKK